jgi:hypothetical protein
MIVVREDIEALAGELESALDEEIGLLEAKRRLLEELSAAMVQRDEGGVERVLEHLDQAQRAQESADVRLAAVRESLTVALGGLEGKKVRLSDLIVHLPRTIAAGLEVRRRQVRMLVDRVRRQHLKTTLMLAESARLNRVLLEGLLTGGSGLTTYGRAGRSDWHGQSGVVDAAW